MTAVVVLYFTSGGPNDDLTAKGAFFGDPTDTKAVEFRLRLNRSQFVAVT